MEERPVVPGEELDSAIWPVVKAKKAPSSRVGIWPGVLGKGKSEAHQRMSSSRDHGHPELHLEYAHVGREADDRTWPILMAISRRIDGRSPTLCRATVLSNDASSSSL